MRDHPIIEACERWGYPQPQQQEQCSMCSSAAYWWTGMEALCNRCARQKALEELHCMETEELCDKLGYEAI